jgi:hypothetical protein
MNFVAEIERHKITAIKSALKAQIGQKRTQIGHRIMCPICVNRPSKCSFTAICQDSELIPLYCLGVFPNFVWKHLETENKTIQSAKTIAKNNFFDSWVLI